MSPFARPFCASLLLFLASQTGVWAQTSCSASQDTCDGAYSSLFAIAHDHNDISNILYRVVLPEQAVGSGWGDGVNGFFYQFQVENEGDWTNLAPFNGIGNNADGVPTLRPFSFIVPVAKGDSTLTIRACSSNYATAVGGLAQCTSVLWTDSYASLPSPTIGSDRSPPPSFPNGFNLEFVSDSVLIRNNGVYGAQVTLKPTANNVQVSLTQDQIDWLYDHIVFVDETKDVHDNNLFPGEDPQTKPFGVLKIEEAGYPVTPGGAEYLIKYTQSNTAVKPTEPGSEALLHFWVYSTDTTVTEPIQLGAGWLYDASADCLGAFNGDAASNSASCTGDAGLEDGEAPYIEVTLLSGGITSSTKPDSSAGLKTVRNVAFSVEDQRDICTNAVNPLAAYSSTAVNLPNYVLNPELASTSWSTGLPPALYYVMPSGFGNCAAGERPFCERTSPYAAYIPHYLDVTNGGGSLNGGGTSDRLVGSVNISDQYNLVGLPTGQDAVNSLIWFDNCGYGYEFNDTDLASRETSLPTPPFSRPSYSYNVESTGSQALALVKECCASNYQTLANSCTGTDKNNNPTGCTYYPPEQIGEGFGMYLPQQGNSSSPISKTYQTLFGAESLAAYSAASGELLYRFVLDETMSAEIQRCPGNQASLTLSPSSKTVSLYDDAGKGIVKCTGAPVCPYGTKENVYAAGGKSYRSCVATNSDFLLNLDLWAARSDVSSAEGIIVTAWGAYGMSGKQGNSGNQGEHGYTGGHAGHGGFAQTVVKPSELPSGLYAYVGTKPSATDYSHSGASSLLSRIPLTSLDPDTWANGTIVNQKHVIVIAGGGGGGGEGSFYGAVPAYQGGYGGNGGTASANSGSAVSAAGTNGKYKGDEETGGHGGNSNGSGNAGNGSAGTGVGGFSGSGETWLHTGSLVPPSTWAPGKGAGSDGTGGGGYGGAGNGGKPHSWASGGGGGGSWAAANTVNLTGVFPTSLATPSQTGGAVALSYPAQCEGDCMVGGQVVVEGTTYQNCVTKEHEGVLIQSGKAYLKWFSNGNVELWKDGGQEEFWNAGQDNKGYELCFTTTGALEIKDEGGHTLFSTNTSNGNYLTLNDCTLSIIDNNGAVRWSQDFDTKCG